MKGALIFSWLSFFLLPQVARARAARLLGAAECTALTMRWSEETMESASQCNVTTNVTTDI